MSFTIDKKTIITYPAEELCSFSVTMYEWIDNLHFTLSPHECLDDPSEYLDIAGELFREAGWDGIGEIRLMWIPPFMFQGDRTSEFTQGVIIWHVKQDEDGLSWILSPIELPNEENLVDISSLLMKTQEILSGHCCNLNIRYDLPNDIWDKVVTVYEKMPGWLGYGDGAQGERGIPYWFSFDESCKSIFASVEPSGLQICASNMNKSEWESWIFKIKCLATSILGFKVGEIENGEVGYEIEWIDPPVSSTDKESRPWWKFW